MSIYKQASEAYKLSRHYATIYDSFKPKLKSYCKKSNENKVVNEYGTWQVVLQPRYRYSSKVEALEVQLDALKATERKNGTAKPAPAYEQLRYKG
jgi:hypothetical protein